jgi:hypothetical protein
MRDPRARSYRVSFGIGLWDGELGQALEFHNDLVIHVQMQSSVHVLVRTVPEHNIFMIELRVVRPDSASCRFTYSV